MVNWSRKSTINWWNSDNNTQQNRVHILWDWIRDTENHGILRYSVIYKKLLHSSCMIQNRLKFAALCITNQTQGIIWQIFFCDNNWNLENILIALSRFLRFKPATNLRVSRQLTCRDICEFVTWSDHHLTSMTNTNFYKTLFMRSKALCEMDPSWPYGNSTHPDLNTVNT